MPGSRFKTILMLMGAAMSAASACAADTSPFIASRKLVLQSFSANGRGVDTAAWRGAVTIHGKLSLDLDRMPDAPGDAGDVESSLSFMPDNASLATLPVVLGKIYPSSPAIIGLAFGKLPDLGLPRFLPAATIAEIRQGGFGHYEWHATLSMRQLETSNGCDARSFFSKRYRITVDGKTMTHLDRAENLGC